MLFASCEKNMYHLLKEYLSENSLLSADTADAIFDRALVARAQEFGFLDLESYCRYVMLQPFYDRISEIRSIIAGYKNFVFYQNKDQLNAVNSRLISEITASGQKKEEKKLSSKILKLLTSEVDFSHGEEMQRFSILSVECGYGQELYSAAMRIFSVLPEKTRMEFIATESNADFLKKASDARFPEPTLSNLGDNYRSLYTEKTKDGLCQITENLRRKVEIRKINILSDPFPDDFAGYFHMIFLNNLHFYYSPAIAALAAEKVIPCLAPEGILFSISLLDKKGPWINELEQITLENAKGFKKKKDSDKKAVNVKINEQNESPENRLLFMKAQLLENRTDVCQEQVKNLLKEHISHPLANHLLGDIYVLKNQYDKALSQYEKVILINPLHGAARFNAALLHLLEERKTEASEQLEKIREKADLIDYGLLEKSFNINREGFLNLTGLLEEVLNKGECPDMSTFRQWADTHSALNIEAPDIKVPDKYGTAILAQEEEAKGEPEEKMGEDDGVKRKVVNISELPSSRDYGKHDPWVKKKAEEEEVKRKADEFSLLHEDYQETVKGKQVSRKKSRKKADSPVKKPGWVDLTDAPPKEKRKPVKLDKPPKTQVVVKTKKKSDADKKS